MIEEHKEELAALDALDLLEPAERTAFESAALGDPELARRAAELREAAAALSRTAPSVEPPPGLRGRVLASLPGHSVTAAAGSRILPFPVLLPWALAAGLAVAFVWSSQLYLRSRSETALLGNQQALAELEMRAVRNQLEAERIVNQRELTESRRDLADASRRLADANRDLAELGRRMRSGSSLADYKVSTLGSMLGSAPRALAVAVWCPSMQEGILAVSNLPSLPLGKDYQLWVVDPRYPAPVSGGVFSVDPATGEARVVFRTVRPIESIRKFAVSLERKGGVDRAEGPMVLLSD
jgi:anti-sigma-K factor RskA